MKIKLLKPCVVAGHPGASVGDILEVTPHTFQVLEGLEAARVVTDEELRQRGPTIEEYVAAGYAAETYPPQGYAEVPSPGLDAYRAVQEAKAKADAAAAEAAAKAQEVAPPEITQTREPEVPNPDPQAAETPPQTPSPRKRAR